MPSPPSGDKSGQPSVVLEPIVILFNRGAIVYDDPQHHRNQHHTKEQNLQGQPSMLVAILQDHNLPARIGHKINIRLSTPSSSKSFTSSGVRTTPGNIPTW